VTYYGNVFDATGYGRAARAYIHAFERAGIRMSVVDLANRPRQVADERVASLLGQPGGSDYHLYHGIPSEWARRAFAHRNTIAMTVWETDTLPSQWRNALNHAVDVWVPSRFNEEVFADALEVPVFRLPHPVHRISDGADALPETDEWLGTCADDFVFYSVFEWQDRKNPEGMIEAFLREFQRERNAVLVLKTNPSVEEAAHRSLATSRRRLRSHARVVLCCAPWTDQQVHALHARGNCYVSLHQGEGWGYPLFDAASRGTPVVATGYSGPLDFLGESYPGCVDYKLTKVQQPYVFYNQLMRWAEPRLEDASQRLRWVYDNYADALRDAERTERKIHRDFSLEAVGEMAKLRLLDLLSQRQPRRGRRLKHQELSRRLRPPVPIPSDWYDEDYFERGIKSNWSEGYRWNLFGDLFRSTAAFLSEAFPETESFLDAGCAKGFLVRALLDAGKDCWGVDHSAWAIDHAEEEAKPFLERCAIEDFRPDRAYDVLIGLHLLESLTEDQARAFLTSARGFTKQAAFFVLASAEQPGVADGEAPEPGENDRDLARVSTHPRAWWHELFLQAGWRQDPLHRVAQRACQSHPLPARMGWNVFLYSPGHA
jgi:glycosyltransferase involved in cell wall biosynthesis